MRWPRSTGTIRDAKSVAGILWLARRRAGGLTDVELHVPGWELMVRATVIYLALLAALRLFGKREVGQFTLIDLVPIRLVANAVQPAMTGPDARSPAAS